MKTATETKKQAAIAVDLYNHTVTGDVTMTLCCERMDPHHMPCVVVVNEDLDQLKWEGAKR